MFIAQNFMCNSKFFETNGKLLKNVGENIRLGIIYIEKNHKMENIFKLLFHGYIISDLKF